MKPPYRVPSMVEINAIPWNGFRVASTFSGCGGSSLGYRMAGFKVIWASEYIPLAREAYQLNATAGCRLDGRDIRQVKPEEVLSLAGLKRGELDLFDGSPPCASFSTAGKREKQWELKREYSGKKQRTDDLFYEYIRLLVGLQPRVFVAENVSGLIKGTAKGYFLEILKAMKATGYRVKCVLLDSQWLGVPQSRKRLFFVGVREDLGLDPVFPKPLPYRYSVRDAIPWVSVKGEGALLRTSPVKDRFEIQEEFTRYKLGRLWAKLRPGQTSKEYLQLCRVDPDKPCPTVCASDGWPGRASISHPFEPRKFSIPEIRRICSFPDDFLFPGTFPQRYERMGRAVPPVMMSHLAATIRDEILRKAKV